MPCAYHRLLQHRNRCSCPEQEIPGIRNTAGDSALYSNTHVGSINTAFGFIPEK